MPDHQLRGLARSRSRLCCRTACDVMAISIGWFTIAIGSVCLVARSVSFTDHFWILAACTVPFVCFAGPIAAAALALARRWVVLTIACVLFALLSAPYARVAVTRPGQPGEQAVVVMTFNMRLGSANAGDVLQQARSHGVGLLMLQEMTPDALHRLRAAGIDNQFGFRYVLPYQGGSGLGLFSRYPLTNSRSYTGFLNQVMSATVALPSGQHLTAFSSHLSAPWPQDASEWKSESARLGSTLGATSGAVIDAGDFNATTSFRAFRNLVTSGDVADAATQAGAVTLRTFPADSRQVPPLIGIDHVLVRDLSAFTAYAVRIRGSDHQALITILSVDAAAASQN